MKKRISFLKQEPKRNSKYDMCNCFLESLFSFGFSFSYHAVFRSKPFDFFHFGGDSLARGVLFKSGGKRRSGMRATAAQGLDNPEQLSRAAALLFLSLTSAHQQQSLFEPKVTNSSQCPCGMATLNCPHLHCPSEKCHTVFFTRYYGRQLCASLGGQRAGVGVR